MPKRNLVVNALLTGDITLRASDRGDTTLDVQTREELWVIGTGEPRLRAIFDGLANGGTVRVPLARQFWGDVFGAITGKYGIGWQVNIGPAGARGPGRQPYRLAANSALRRHWPVWFPGGHQRRGWRA